MRKALIPFTLVLVAFAAGMFDAFPALAQQEDLYNGVFIPDDELYALANALSLVLTIFLLLIAAILAFAAMIRKDPDQK